MTMPQASMTEEIQMDGRNRFMTRLDGISEATWNGKKTDGNLRTRVRIMSTEYWTGLPTL